MIVQIILFLVAAFLILKLYLGCRKPPGTPPGTNGLPIIGLLPGRNENFEEFVDSCRKKYGDIFWLKMGIRKTVFVCKHHDITAAFNNPALLGRSLLYSNLQLYQYSERDISRRDVPVHKMLGVLMGVGSSWKNVRRFIIRTLRDGGMGKSSMEDIILREAQTLSDDFARYAGRPTEVPWSVNTSILNIIWGLVGDRRYDIFDEDIQNLCKALQDALTIVNTGGVIFDLFPALHSFTPEFVLNYLGKKELHEKMTMIYKQLFAVIDEHKRTLDEDNPRDLIDAYLIELRHIQNDSSKKLESCTFNERELSQMVFDLFIAGTETTSSTIKWYILFMAKNLSVQKKIQKELDNAIPKNRMISLSDRVKLPYLEASINETLRRKAILPIGLFHLATEDTNLREYFIPKGTHVVAGIAACHKDAEYWERPNEFYPEHFLNPDGTFNNKKEGLVAFSTGRRVCLGENLARMDLFLILATLHQRFTFTAPEGEILSDEVSKSEPYFTLPRNFKMIITERH